MQYITNTGITELRSIREQIHSLGLQRQSEEIRRVSPYSGHITPHIRLYNELAFYYSLRLQESVITRPTLIKEIDFELWVSSEGCTNLELMQNGSSPYAFDSPDGKIELHHIGQAHAAPFAELTAEEHDRNSKLLHYSNEPSWRNDEALNRDFLAERSAYWKKRAENDYTVSSITFDALEEYHYQNYQEYMEELRDTCEEIYAQCSVENLDYLSDLAKSYSMMNRMGATTMSEYISNTQDAANETIRCISCGSKTVSLCGSYQTQGDKVQRFRCKDCGKVFSPISKTLISGSSFSFREWIKFIDCLYNGYTIKQTANACDLSEKAAHENRAKLFYALKLLNDRVCLQGNIVIDETYLPVSFKGNHSNQENFVMPRAAYKRGGENHQRGITDNLVCIVCAVDDLGNSVAKVAGTGNPSATKLKYVLQDHLGEDVSCLYSDKSTAIKAFAESCGYPIKQAKLLCKGRKRATGVPLTREVLATNRYLQVVNGYHARLKRFLSRFSGISTKYLSGYLYLFAWKERNKDHESIEAYKELLLVMIEPNNYIQTEEILKGGYLPDAVSINKDYRKREYTFTERDKEIYRRYASGETMTSIAKDYGVTKQNISLIVKALRRNGMAYKTQKDIERERTRTVTPQGHISKESLEKMIRDYQIYEAKQNWTGSYEEFNQAMSEKYHISTQRVKNIVATVKRMLRLKDEIYIYEEISYRSREEVYRDVYADFTRLWDETPHLPMNTYAKMLSEKHNLTSGNIIRIIDIMEIEDMTGYFAKKRRLTSEDAYKRDKAIFVDYLRFNGTRSDFCRYAAQKYNLSYLYVEAILKYCLYADIERYNMV